MNELLLAKSFIFFIGFVVGFIMSIFTLDRLYRQAYKDYTNEVVNQYNTILEQYINKGE